ncbi:hypothetical protein DYE50_11175 [Treponema ruminis]|uniref:Surface polysaccharide O-acyltransferase-like enzyme n=1 Tax=Treponema ruminis TaxID=744515 RepID=A0A7W8G8T7_9SPIR|nr:acyltransferase family protein [Treponema ruminis]MBB5225960.1 surface polysaccharide O-acyltransferase-like enzyme [Treponema ruminis]QSI03128.1 hypothetical protein DYE50_11175 [Treponema ruminis]
MAARRDFGYDLIRIIAILMVVMIHVSAYVVTYFDPDTDNITFVIGNIFNGLGRAGTPLFMLLSGALLLNEEKQFDTQRFYSKSLLGICMLLLFWLFFYASWRTFGLPRFAGKPVESKLFLDYLLRLRGRFPHLWYLFMLVGAYLAVPVLRLFVKKENRNYILGFIVLAIVVQFASQSLGVFTYGMDFTVRDFMNKFHFEYATGYIPYMLAGWYLVTFPPKGKLRSLIIVSGFVALVFIVLSVQFKINSNPKIRDYMVEMNTLPAFVYGVGIFTLMNSISGGQETKGKAVQLLSASSFGVYITHVFFLDVFLVLIPYKSFAESRPFVYILLIFALTFTSSFAATLIFSKIKGIRKLVRA